MNNFEKNQFFFNQYSSQNFNSQSPQIQDQSSSFLQSSQIASKKQPLQRYYDLKRCQQCQSQKDSRNMLLCQRCQDGYHIECLQLSRNFLPSPWICPQCQKDLRNHQKKIKQIIIEKNQKDQKFCAYCKKYLQKYEVLSYLKQHQNKLQKDLFNIEFSSSIQCTYCKKIFHQTCFNIRQNCLNCQKCELKIRKQCPKGHNNFMKYYYKTAQQYKKDKFMILTPLQKNYNCQRYQKFGFKIPKPVTNWQLITQYEASIFYAFKTKKLHFVQDQIYENSNIMELNRTQNQIMQILSLDECDEKTFQKFKQNVSNGLIGPYEIKQDKKKGFYIIATNFIERMTIVCQYVGEVMCQRDSLFYQQNDSIFMLLKNISSIKSLDIVPNRFSNMSRFFSGINNNDKKAKRLINIETMRFNYKGRIRILFYASKNIQAGDSLYFDYNGGPFNQYPTENFTH